MKHVLFVDDEPRVLDGLRRGLHSRRGHWEMAFVESGEGALAELAKAPFDVIVSDMRMPVMDGAALLKRVQADYPSMVRIILSGHSEVEAALRAVPVAHQFLTKPCTGEMMVDVIERACSLQSLLADESIRRAVGALGSLPSQPKIYQQLTHLLADPDSSVKDVACVVEQDVAMCAKILQLVNSSFFSMPRRLATIEAAVGFLGTNMLKQLTLSVEAFRAWEKAISIPGFSLESLMEHGLMVANIASRLLTVKRDTEDAFMAGMLHDIGRLILAAGFPEKLGAAFEISRAEGRPLEIVEREVIGVSHSYIGAYLLGLWGVSYTIVEAVAYHDEPGQVGESTRFDVLAAVRIADQLAHECAPENGADGIEARLDLGYLEALGVADRLPEWRRMAQEMVESRTN